MPWVWQFARIFTCDDIVEIKKAGAEAEGLIIKAPPLEYVPGVKVDEIVAGASLAGLMDA